MLRQFTQFDVGGNGVALLLAELDRRIRNSLMTIDAAVKQTHSTSAEDYRTELIARITGLRSFCEVTRHHRRKLGLVQRLEQRTRARSANGAQVVAAGPDVELEPSLALALDLVFHELTANASKFCALSVPLRFVKVEWSVSGIPRRVAIVWVEHREVSDPRQVAFASWLIKTVRHRCGGVRLDHDSAGFACCMLIDLDRADARLKAPRAAPDMAAN